MDHELIVKSTIRINAPAVKVWDALTNPDQTKKYMFGCRAISDWKPGSPLLWRGNDQGEERVFVKGSIVEIEPEKFLAYTTIDAQGAVEDKPANYLTVTYALSTQDAQTILTVTQDDYAKVADGEKRFQEAWKSGEGWNPLLVQIKALAES